MIAIASSADFHAAVAAATAKPLVVYFTSTQCSQCEDVAPKVAALADELANNAAFVTVSAEELDALAKELQVDSFPHFRVYKHKTIAGDCSSSAVDEVDAFIRGHLAPEPLKTDDALSVSDAVEQKTVEEEEDSAGKKEGEEMNGTGDAEAVNCLKKRQEREEMESSDGHDVKKIKTDDGAVEIVDDEDDEDDDAATEEAETTDVAPEEDETPDGTEKKREEAAAADKIEASAAADASDVAAA